MKRHLADFGALSPAEARLAEEVGRGEVVDFGPDLPEAEAGPERVLRADFLRYLLLGGCAALPEPVSASGLRVAGARITGPLVLRNVATSHFIELTRCRFDAPLNLLAARSSGIYLPGSLLPGIEAPMLQVEGTLLLDGARITGPVRLPGGRVTGQVRFPGAVLQGGGRMAAELHGLESRGSVIFDRAKIEGEICLAAGKIAGGVECAGADFKPAGGNPVVLSLEGATVRNTLRFDAATRIGGVLNLTAASVGDIQDEEASWPAPGDLILDQFRYGGFSGGAITAKARKRWLALQDPARWGKEFWPQPWEQCAKVMREMGLAAEARAVLIDKEILQRKALRARMRWPARLLRWWIDLTIGATTRYGRRPLLAVWWLVLFWLIGVGVFSTVEHAGAIKPNTVLTQRSAEWMACAPSYAQVTDAPAPRWRAGFEDQLDCFRAQPEAEAYPRFNAWIYSADTLLPIVDMEMQSFWVPDEKHAPFGQWGRAYLWWQISVGWALSLLTVAGISGLIKTDNA